MNLGLTETRDSCKLYFCFFTWSKTWIIKWIEGDSRIITVRCESGKPVTIKKGGELNVYL